MLQQSQSLKLVDLVNLVIGLKDQVLIVAK